ncbi:MAG: hypothetical protein ACM3UV_05805 [Nocardioidaceae bacterium]
MVAFRTAATPALIGAVRQRAERGPASFTLLVPSLHQADDPEEAAQILELAIPLLEEAAGGLVEGLVGDPDPYVAVLEALRARDFDEFIVSTLPPGVSRWLSRDLPSRLAGLGRHVTVVTARRAAHPLLGPPAPP